MTALTRQPTPDDRELFDAGAGTSFRSTSVLTPGDRIEIATLLQRRSRLSVRHPDGAYYIGSLVTHAARDRGGDRPTYEVVDGQQRLTTLYIVLATLERHGQRPDRHPGFEGRERSSCRPGRAGPAWQGLDRVEDLQEFGIKVGVETV